MPWSLRQVSGQQEYQSIREKDGALATIGLWWYVDPSKFTPNKGTAANGQCVCVVLPPGGAAGWFYPYHVYQNNQQWTVEGDWPNVTITPSINCPGYYHGWIRDGQITDDCEGRVFNGQ